MLNKVIISGGGTGGHIFPAIAIAQELERQNPNVEILFVGAKGRMEMDKVPQFGYRIVGLPIAGIQRKLDWRNLILPFKLLWSLIMAVRLIVQFKPEAVIGVGGYASGPTLWAANVLGRKTFIQEQNSFAGVTNKILSKKATRIFTAYPGMDRFFPKDKIIQTGNPIRFVWDEGRYPKADALKHFGLAEGKKTLLMVGGSLGARAMNQIMEAHLEALLQKDVQVIWQTGKHYLPQAKWKERKGLWVGPFIQEMHQAYAAADVIVSRAGAMSVSELCWVAKPTVFVPSPYVAEDHQTHNAMALVSDDAALMIRERELTERWLPTLLGLLSGEMDVKHMALNMQRWAKPNASADIVQQLIQDCYGE
jgi:UDP-N-acetylglucosamine--N-acetylmuramyl-(pentapeptide) pyrophosphoryl-undecaprenol N-acetylglucosamine transferase